MNILCAKKILTKKTEKRPLRLTNGKVAPEISRLAKIFIDIDEYRQKTYGYVVRGLAYPIILEKPWIKTKNVKCTAKKRQIHIGEAFHIVEASNKLDKLDSGFMSVPLTKCNTLLSRKEIIGSIDDTKPLKFQ